MKLKTLKDLVNWTCKCNCVTFDGEICRRCKKPTEKYGEIDFDDVKKESIKWVKRYENNLEYWEKHPEEGKRGNHIIILKDKILWITHFFNITEKELKNG
ncbi:hypothetical protein LCGC14_0862580 [marine sediment metagenome]|uniref:Uncharacterized protein n=1 Tax=marine sediment metagenome TaxID=412755 RepID=A0A0F9RRJ8_9ZZZZ|nr:hypothetical protein [Candidatus Aminicenantes bacterium]